MIGGDLLYEGIESRYRRIAEAYSSVRGRLSVAKLLAGREVLFERSVSLPLRRRISLWRRGFTSRSGVLFDVDERGYDDLMSDYQLEQLGDLGGRWGDVFANKLTSRLLLGSFEEHLPDFYGVLDDGVVRRRLPFVSDPVGAADSPERTEARPWMARALDAGGALVLKPIYGYGGKGVFVCRKSADDDGYLINGDPVATAEFGAFVDDLEEYGIWEFVEQADYAEALFPDSVNTLRVLTLHDEAGEPFVAGAIHRIGTADSAPVDNWSRGGLSAELREDGTLSSGARWPPSADELRWYDVHPDTGERIEGTRVPDWPAVRERILSMAAEFPYLPRIGWDVVVTDDGFVVLEVNSHAGIETLQIHRPHLDDPRTRRFYERHGYL